MGAPKKSLMLNLELLQYQFEKWLPKVFFRNTQKGTDFKHYSESVTTFAKNYALLGIFDMKQNIFREIFFSSARDFDFIFWSFISKNAFPSAKG